MTPQNPTDIWALANYGAVGVIAAFALTMLALGARWLLAELRRKDVMFAESLRYITDKHEAAVAMAMDKHERTSQAIVAAIDKLAGEVRTTARG